MCRILEKRYKQYKLSFWRGMSDDIRIMVANYLTPYLEYATKVVKDNYDMEAQLEKQYSVFIESLKDQPLNNAQQMCLYYICQARLTIALQKINKEKYDKLPRLLKCDINNLTSDNKVGLMEMVVNRLKELETPALYEKITKGQFTGDVMLDYYLLLVMKRRGWANKNEFGTNTTTFQTLKRRIKELQSSISVQSSQEWTRNPGSAKINQHP